jgi:KDO2-lipid IV(A) lauroyltransferase
MSATTHLSPGQRLRYIAEAVPFFAFMALFRVLGIDAASNLGGFIGRHVFYRLGPAHTARQNLRAAYPEKGDAERDAIVRDVCENLGRVVAEYAHLDKMTLGQGGRIEVEGVEYADDAIARGKGVMFISGHLANWEVMPIAAQHHGYKGGLVYRPPNNPFVDRWISRQRAKQGPSDQITKSAQGTRRIFSLLRKGKCIFMLVDQKTYQGVPAPFFGRDALTTSAPASLALKLGSVLLPASCERTDGAHFRMRVHPPVSFAPSGDFDADVLALTRKINETIETIVRHRPSQWLWIHRRWTLPRDLLKMKNQAAVGSGVRVEREGSSLT